MGVTMFYTGLVSVTFRSLAPLEIVLLAARAGVDSIEWGGDVHVLPGDLATATLVHKLTADAGLQVSAYGSYYRVGQEEKGVFETVLETAVALNAPVIRVWAGKQGSAQANKATVDQIVQDSQRIASLAAAANIAVGYEFHNNSLTDRWETALALLKAVSHPNMKIFWQPPHKCTLACKLAGLQAVLPYLLNVHVFHWHVNDQIPPTYTRLPLAQGKNDWAVYISALQSSKRDHFLSLEFVQNDDPENFLEDAAVLLDLLQDAGTLLTATS